MERVYCRHVEEHSQKERHLGESSMDMTLSQAMWETGWGRRGLEPGAAARRYKGTKKVGNQDGWII